MSYDFHHPWESQTAHHAPLFPSNPTDQLSVVSDNCFHGGLHVFELFHAICDIGFFTSAVEGAM